MIDREHVDASLKYAKYDKMLEMYKDTAQTIEKIKRERTVEVQRDVFDLAMKKIGKQAELEMLEIELK